MGRIVPFARQDASLESGTLKFRKGHPIPRIEAVRAIDILMLLKLPLPRRCSVDLIGPSIEVPGQLAKPSAEGLVDIETGVRIEPGTNVFVLGPAEFRVSGQVLRCHDQQSTFVVGVDVSEKRRSTRVKTQANAHVKVFSGAPAMETMIEIIEASTQGFGFHARQPFALGSVLQISLDYAMVLAEVRHCRRLPSGIYRGGVEIARVMCFATKPLVKHRILDLAAGAQEEFRSGSHERVVVLEKRSEPRIDCVSAAELSIFSDTITTIAATISNISRSGLQIFAGAPMAPGDQILVRFKKLIVFAEVRYCHPSGKAFVGGARIWDIVGERDLCDHLHQDAVELLAHGYSFPAAERLFSKRLRTGCPCCDQYAQATEALLRRAQVIQGSY